VFGGVLFIALLIAIQIQQTVGHIQQSTTTSPEEIAETRQQLDQISADIDASRVLLETLQTSMPRPKDPADQARADLFYKLSAAKGAAVAKEAELLNLRWAMEKEMLDWEETIKTVVTTLQHKESERQKLNQEIEQRKQEQQAANKSSAELQSEIDELNRQIARKERNIQDSAAHSQRNEIVYLPKLQDAGSKRPVYFVLRFNRFYKVSNRSDFNYTGKLLGIPKQNRGIPVEDTEDCKRQLRSLFQNHNNSAEFLSAIVYGDSADDWYIIRDLIVDGGFKYELLPSADDTLWNFGGSGGSAAVQ
jgi:septal ring factor EnvC (AmiA/AmiB activator)